MAIKKTDILYSPSVVKKWFFISSFLFLIAIVAMAFKDFFRPWKNFQLSMMSFKSEILKEKIEEAKGEIDEDELNEAKASLNEAQENLKSKKAELAELGTEAKEKKAIWAKADQAFRFRKATFDVTKYNYEVLRKKKPDAPKVIAMGEEVQSEIVVLAGLQRTVELTKSELDAVQAKITEHKDTVKNAEKQISDIKKQVTQLEMAMAKLKKDPLFLFLNGPMTDFIAPTIKVKQVVLPEVRYSNNFTTVQRVDRCMTCHVSIDQKGFEELPNPWKTHPRLDLIMGASSPHPMEKTGCTICHSGQGESADFNYAAHTPRDQKQAAQWAKPVKVLWHSTFSEMVNTRLCLSEKYGDTESCQEYFKKHMGKAWENVRYALVGPCKERDNRSQAACKVVNEKKDPQTISEDDFASVKVAICGEPKPAGKKGKKKGAGICGTDYPSKEAVVGGYDWHDLHYWDMKMLPLQYSEANCVKCHQEERYVPGGQARNDATRSFLTYGCYGCHKTEQLGPLPKPAPSLRKVSGKLSREFVQKWVYDPWSFNPKTRMPKHFGLENRTLNEKEKAWEKEEALALANFVYDLSTGYKPMNLGIGRGNVERGKKLVTDLGCLGCHASDDNPQAEMLSGPQLNNLGSKLNRKWLQSWLKNPRHFNDKTRMPSFRLSNNEIAHITEYLLSQRNEAFDSTPAYKSDPAVRDEVLTQHMMSRLSKKSAEEQVAAMSEEERNKELGKFVMNFAGCWGCHDIEGYEKTPGIGAELTKEGDKFLSRFDFGHRYDVPHTKHDWIYNKIREPRMWDKGKVLKWTDRSRMPQFYWREGEVQKLTHYVVGLTDNSSQPLQSKKVLDKHEKLAEAGRRVFNDKLCTSCHLLIPYNVGGDYLAYFEDDHNLGPPKFNLQGEKLHPDWFRKFLLNPVRIRPWITKMRMPSFHYTNDEMTTLIGGFNGQDRQSFPWYDDEVKEISGNDFKQAHQLFVKLECTTCHTLGPIKPGTDVSALAPNLRLARKRLRYSWMKKWILEPQKLVETTRMTPLWFKEDDEDPKSPWSTAYPEYFGGDALKQVDMITRYVYTIGYKQDPWQSGMRTVEKKKPKVKIKPAQNIKPATPKPKGKKTASLN